MIFAHIWVGLSHHPTPQKWEVGAIRTGMPRSHKLAPPGIIPLATVLPHKATVCFLLDIHCQCLEVRKFHTVTNFLTSLEKIWPYCQKTPSGAMLPSPARCVVSRHHSPSHYLSLFFFF